MFGRWVSNLALIFILGSCSASEEVLKASKITEQKSGEKCNKSQYRPTSAIKTDIDQAVSSLSCEVDSDCKVETYSDGSGCQPAWISYSTRQTNERNLFALLEEYSDSANACKKVDPNKMICPAVVFNLPEVKCSANKVCVEEWNSPQYTDPPQTPAPIDRLITEGCSQYYDGCNECSVQADSTSVCTERACEQNTEPYCIQINMQKCASWYDGCNSCSLHDNGQTVCTMRHCETSQRTRPSCTTLR